MWSWLVKGGCARPVGCVNWCVVGFWKGDGGAIEECVVCVGGDRVQGNGAIAGVYNADCLNGVCEFGREHCGEEGFDETVGLQELGQVIGLGFELL